MYVCLKDALHSCDCCNGSSCRRVQAEAAQLILIEAGVHDVRRNMVTRIQIVQATSCLHRKQVMLSKILH